MSENFSQQDLAQSLEISRALSKRLKSSSIVFTFEGSSGTSEYSKFSERRAYDRII